MFLAKSSSGVKFSNGSYRELADNGYLITVKPVSKIPYKTFSLRNTPYISAQEKYLAFLEF